MQAPHDTGELYEIRLYLHENHIVQNLVESRTNFETRIANILENHETSPQFGLRVLEIIQIAFSILRNRESPIVNYEEDVLEFYIGTHGNHIICKIGDFFGVEMRDFMN